MKLSSATRILFATYLVQKFMLFVGASDDLTWTYQTAGQYGTCATDTTVIQGICGSGANADCAGHYTAFGCGKYPDTFNTTDNSNLDEKAWACYDYGAEASCPDGYVMNGFCGSGKNHDCHGAYCNPAMAFAIKCVEAPPSTQLGAGEWLAPTGFGGPTVCPVGQVACGACGSGENEDCGGGANRIKCCGAYNVLGKWEYKLQIPDATSTTHTFSVGFESSSSYTKTDTFNTKVTATVSAGLEVEGAGSMKESLSVSQSESMSSSYSQYWETDTTSTTSYTWNSSYKGYEVYQWVFDITDPNDVQSSALSETFAVTPPNMVPKCLPGKAEKERDGKLDYQKCSEYLPQYEPTNRRGLLRGGSDSA